jgi:hypothetical protein
VRETRKSRSTIIGKDGVDDQVRNALKVLQIHGHEFQSMAKRSRGDP